MERYYFIQKGNIKHGPYKLIELNQHTIYFDELIWRSDNDEWKKASEFEELKGIYIIRPPLTPEEERLKHIRNRFFKELLPIYFFVYLIISFIISIASYSIAWKEWENEKSKYIINKDMVGQSKVMNKKDELKEINEELSRLRKELKNVSEYVIPIWNKKKNKSEIDSMNRYYYLKAQINRTQLDSSYHEAVISQTLWEGSLTIQPIYRVPDNVTSLENRDALAQSFLFRGFRAFFSTIYLSRQEQNNARKLFLNLTISTFASLAFIFIGAVAIDWSIKRVNARKIDKDGEDDNSQKQNNHGAK
ncbi:MAG: DUF4339 domain-containing protein [Cyclobacteriaceae bacterium]